MRAKEALTEGLGVAISDDGTVARIFYLQDGLYAGMCTDLVSMCDVKGDDWQPLDTEAAVLARHPTLRKLGEGEAVVCDQQYFRRHKRLGGWEGYILHLGHPKQDPNYTYYELPPLPEPEAEREEEAIEEAADAFCARHTAEPERGPLPTPEENPNGFHGRYIIRKVSGEPVDPNALYFVLRLDSEGDDLEHVAACQYAAEAYIDLVLNKPEARHLHQMARELAERIGYEPFVGEPELKHVPFKKVGTKKVRFVEPAPSVVGERLTEPPEVGTPVVCFRELGGWAAWQWSHGDYRLYPSNRYYLWLGEIPTEPPAKVEPPKFPRLGLVASGMSRMCVTKIVGDLLVGVRPDGDVTVGSRFSQWHLITDDPAYPPSPELAQLFAEGVKHG